MPPCALDGFQQDGAGFVRYLGFHAVKIIKISEFDATDEGLERLLIMGLPVTDRAPMVLPWKEWFMAMIS